MYTNSDVMSAMFLCIEEGRFHADQVMTFMFDGLDTAVREAECSVRLGDKEQAVAKLRELQAHAERLIAALSPEVKDRLRLVTETQRDTLSLGR